MFEDKPTDDQQKRDGLQLDFRIVCVRRIDLYESFQQLGEEIEKPFQVLGVLHDTNACKTELVDTLWIGGAKPASVIADIGQLSAIFLPRAPGRNPWETVSMGH